MKELSKINISIVLYNNNLPEIINKIAILSSSKYVESVFLVDNSDTLNINADDFSDYKKVIYLSGHGNIGYGRGHNLAFFHELKKETKYHLIVNLDVDFDIHVLQSIVEYMDKNDDIVQLMPRILNPDMTIQRVCKKLPTPFNLISRRFLPNSKITSKINDGYEISDYDYSYILDSPYLSGCFMFCRSSAFNKIGGFDERYFMYPEDIDLTRRMYNIGRTICYPDVYAIHEHGKASYKSKKMTYIHAINMVKYFNKWGWIRDRERVIYNQRLEKGIKKKTF